MSVAPTEAPAYQLNTSHRCDKCGSQAYVRVMLKMSLHLPDGGTLLWCNHHWQEYKYGLSGLIEHVTDETSRLAEHIQPPEATELNSIKK